MNDIAIKIIMNHIRASERAPKKGWPKEYLEQASYFTWASYMILQLIMDNPLTPASELIDGFFINMDYYSRINENTCSLFSIAAEAAIEISYLCA